MNLINAYLNGMEIEWMEFKLVTKGGIQNNVCMQPREGYIYLTKYFSILYSHG